MKCRDKSIFDADRLYGKLDELGYDSEVRPIFIGGPWVFEIFVRYGQNAGDGVFNLVIISSEIGIERRSLVFTVSASIADLIKRVLFK
jgi:hypothetical protein